MVILLPPPLPIIPPFNGKRKALFTVACSQSILGILPKSDIISIATDWIEEDS
jgi:hypothetical protein